MASMTEHMQTQGIIPSRLKSLTSLLRELRAWQARRAIARRTYRELASLTDRELADIGLSRWQIAEVARRSAEAVR
ncbi:protein of unknown function [Meinhardsimonia xiamenensis]|jgi:uncharacterized protein YjiS (DUF1127 family)|uniref:YjiS-like domain-containing protein n=1 Tax=Meinhardsimonia xiamenensis TaxID=990712 RepID=A0A1G9B907_9RHOB|nr:DUF1127 domain-containing protein [Meinhardsimonia xiamenensis]PRX35073.1 uncharacterized protein DUF1127 [Meinhardsimonia xiamenensis]SDK35949.1 protein of unknown function [Meinhardsimonia xiamenensis]